MGRLSSKLIDFGTFPSTGAAIRWTLGGRTVPLPKDFALAFLKLMGCAGAVSCCPDQFSRFPTSLAS
jgi:hypothetical protein